MPLSTRLLAVVGTASIVGAFALALTAASDEPPFPAPPTATATPTATPTPTPTSQPPTLFLAPDGDDGAVCSRTAPCRSFAAAYARAHAGDTVELAAGTYGPQTLERDRAKASGPPVWFQPADGARVRVGDLLLGGNTTEVRGAGPIVLSDLNVGNVVTQRADGLRLSRVDVRGNVYVQGGRGFRMEGGRSGGTNDGSHSSVTAWSGATGLEPARDVVFDGVEFHDTQMGKPADHVECLQATDVVGLTIRNSRFTRCDTFDVRIDAYRTEAPRDVLIENNVFEETSDRFGGNVRYGLAVRAGIGVTIRHNSSESAFAGPEPAAVASDWSMVGNALPSGRCDDRITYHANLWLGGAPCAPTDRAADTAFVDAAGGDYRLVPDSPGIDLVPPGAVQRDYEGRPRPSGTASDAGAFEH